MKNIFKNFWIIILVSSFLVSCTKRPDMAYEQEDKGAKQEIENFNVTSSAENFRESSEKFFEDAKDILDGNVDKPLKRRASFSNDDVEKKPNLQLVDHNQFVKKLERNEVTIKLNNMDIKSALKLFAGLVQRNIIIGKEVTGTLTIDFENIKWGSAVYAILDINNLIMIEDKDSGLLRVHSKEKFIELENAKIQRTLEVNANQTTLTNGSTVATGEAVEELRMTEVFKVFYQTSEDMMDPLEEIIGEDRISIIDDEANNQLLITATPADLNRAEELLDQLDLEKKQVMIEAYIINAQDGFSENLNNELIAFNENANQPGREGITSFNMFSVPGTSNKMDALDAPSDDSSNTVFNGTDGMPVSGGAIIIGKIGMNRIKALIQNTIDDSNTETIANPKLFALDGESATLKQGLTQLKVLPATGEADAAIQEISQTLDITVTPTVIGDGQIKIVLSLNNDSPGQAVDTELATNEESITSTIRLNDGDVAVLGGVYKNDKTDSSNYVPFFSKLPLLGTFFRKDVTKDDKNQLLIFLSARIV